MAVDLDALRTISDSDTENVPNLEEEESKKEASGLNPDFVFDMGDDLDEGFQGWDFGEEKKSEKNVDVDLDGIIKRKGGLSGMLKVGEGEEEEVEAEKEDEDEEEDDELAMDGFGMGVKEDEEKEEKVVEEAADKAAEEDADQEDNEEDSEEEKDSEEAIKEYFDTSAKKSLYKDFQSMNLSRPVLKGLSALGYTTPTPVQSSSIPIALMGKDIVAGAQTGSGKTAAYMIPIIERLLYKPSKVAATRVVIMAPTRELAIQVADVARRIAQFVSGITIGMAIGGLNLRQQEQELKKRPDIVIATPGRFIDHVRNSASFTVDSVEIMVLDEADRMLEEGFHTEITEILQLLPQKKQTLLFSATMNSRISDLIQLSLKKPVRIMIDPPKAAASGLTQEFIRVRKRANMKPALLYDTLSKLASSMRIIVFVATKSMAHRLRIIMGLLGLKVGELHGSLTQDQRLKSITGFKKLTVPILICTDLAARGLDIPKIEVVINYDMPKSHEIYLHRVGRTARAGRQGMAISLVGDAAKERKIVKEAIKQVEESGEGKVLGRKVDWEAVDQVNAVIESKDEVISEVMDEEKSEKEMLRAEMELKKGENILKYKEEIESRPKRTWFQTEQEKKEDKQRVFGAMSKNKKRKEKVDDEDGRSYKKTKKDRADDQSGKRRKEERMRKIKKKKDKKKNAAKMRKR